MPIIPGINLIPFQSWDASGRGEDALKIQEMCSRTKADCFISTYYSSPVRTPSVVLHHDFIPEIRGSRLQEVPWKEKQLAIAGAAGHVCVSHNTAADLLFLNPSIPNNRIRASALGIAPGIGRAEDSAVKAFRDMHGLSKPYLLFVGERIGLVGEPEDVAGYKNAALLFRAMHQWEESGRYQLVLIGGNTVLEEKLRDLAPELLPIMISPDDKDLAAAYSGAEALVYPSKYEGFGLPVLEAMACACPVITTKLSSLPEVAGGAAIYIDPDDKEGLRRAIVSIQNNELKQNLIGKGLERAAGFEWRRLADDLWSECVAISDGNTKAYKHLINLLRCIQASSESLRRKLLQSSVGSHPIRCRMIRWRWLITLKIAVIIENIVLCKKVRKFLNFIR